MMHNMMARNRPGHPCYSLLFQLPLQHFHLRTTCTFLNPTSKGQTAKDLLLTQLNQAYSIVTLYKISPTSDCCRAKKSAMLDWRPSDRLLTVMPWILERKLSCNLFWLSELKTSECSWKNLFSFSAMQVASCRVMGGRDGWLSRSTTGCGASVPPCNCQKCQLLIAGML